MKYISIALIGIFLASCTSKKKAFEVKDFQPFANFQYDKDTLVLPSDLSDAVIQGISIPSAKQCKEGYFKVTFSVKNTSEAPQAYRYKLFYQNETYKFLEYSVV